MGYRIALISLGCPKNQVNSEQMLYLLDQAGHELVGDPAGCDVAIVNTCGFIDSAKSEAIDHILALAELKKAGQLKKILVAGCLSQRYEADILESLPEVDGMLGTGSFGQICTAVDAVMQGEQPLLFGDKNGPIEEIDRVVSTGPGWAYLRIAEGCDNWCAFCAIPAIRGKYRSRKPEAILAEARALAAQGVKELIVIAQDITRYGVDLYGKPSLAGLLKQLVQIDGVEWIRLHYLYPDQITDELIDVIAEEPKIVKYLDIPLQHVSKRILRAMHRPGDGAEFTALIEDMRRRIPGLVLRTSLIVGLPGETDDEFAELCEFLQNVAIERVGVFEYSPEEGTEAAEMPDQIDAETKQNRRLIVEELQSGVLDDYNTSRHGEVMQVLVEGFDDEQQLWYGRTYADSVEVDGHVYFDAMDTEPGEGEFVSVLITESLGPDLLGVRQKEA